MATVRPVWSEPIRPGLSVVVDVTDAVVVTTEGAIVVVPSPTEWRERRRRSNRLYDRLGVTFDGMGTYDGITSVAGDEETPTGQWGRGVSASRPVWGTP